MRVKPDIYKFLDYEKFLKEFSEFMKSKYGIRELERLCKLSPGYLSDIFAFKKEMTERVIHSFVSIGHLEPKEGVYLEALQRFSRANSPEDRYVYLRELSAIGRGHEIHDKLLAEEMSLQFWYLSTVRKLLQHPKVGGTAQDIAQAIWPQPAAREFQKALDCYVQAGLIEKKKDQEYGFLNRTVKWGENNENLFLQKFHREMLARTAVALDSPFNIREFQAMTFLSHQRQMEKMKQTIDQFLTRFYEKFAQEFDGSIQDDSEVFQVNLQLFQTSRVSDIAK